MIAFKKYISCGNQYVVLNDEDCAGHEYDTLAKHICNPHIGIGCDGLIIAKQNPFAMLTYLEDGNVASTYGNDVHCFANYAYDNGWLESDEFIVKYQEQDIHVQIMKKDPFKANVIMGTPSFDIGHLKLSQYQFDVKEYQIDEYTVGSLYFNGIQTIMMVDSLDSMDLESVAKTLTSHTLYKEDVTINFVEIMGQSNLRVITYTKEKGFVPVDCNGCCASMILVNDFAKVQNLVNVHVDYGVLHIRYKGNELLLETTVKLCAKGMCTSGKEE